MISLLLNRMFSELLRAGELDFLHGKSVSIRIEDLGLDLCFSLQGRRFMPAAPQTAVDLGMAGSLYDFTMLATRKEDPDTLFFNRRLKLSGDTELGLALKNLLDAQEFPLPNLPAPMVRMLEGSAGFWQRLRS